MLEAKPEVKWQLLGCLAGVFLFLGGQAGQEAMLDSKK